MRRKDIIFYVHSKIKNIFHIFVENRVKWYSNYKRWVFYHILKAANLALIPKVITLFEDANNLLKKVKMKISVQEKKL